MLVDWVDMRLRVPLAIVALALTLAPLAAPLLAASHPLAALLIRNFFSQLCHQDPRRSFVVDGAAVAVCVRCLGIYWGTAVGMMVRLRRARWLLALALIVNLADVCQRNDALARECAGFSILFRVDAWPGGGSGSFLTVWPKERAASVRAVGDSAFADGQADFA